MFCGRCGVDDDKNVVSALIVCTCPDVAFDPFFLNTNDV